MFKYKKIYVVLGLLLSLNCCYIKPLSYPKPENKNNYYLRDTLDRITIYHGVNVSNYSKHSEGNLPWQSNEDFYKMKDWGFNIVRYLVFWSAIEPTKGNYDTVYINNVLNQIKFLDNIGITTIIDIHQDLYADTFGGNGFPDWTIDDDSIPFGGLKEPWSLTYLDPAVIASYNNFWNNKELKTKYIKMIDLLVNTFDTIPGVLGIDVMNEPIPNKSPNRFERTTLTKFYYNIEKVFVGSKLKMFFEPWMSTSSMLPSCLNFKPKVSSVYYPHYYDVYVDAQKPYEDLSKNIMNNMFPLKISEAQKYGVPIMIGEFGVSLNYNNFLKDLLNIYDKYNVGWCYYAYDKLSYSYYGILDDNGNLRPQMKYLVRAYPQKIAGNNPKWQTTEHEFTLQYEKHGNGQTEIYIPRTDSITIITYGSWLLDGKMLYYTNTDSLLQQIRITY
jgi:endoglycosylceramidase